MKQQVKGVKYNTDTAVKLGAWTNNESGTGCIREALHRTKTGRYFLHCFGSTKTKYAVLIDGEPAPREFLQPLTLEVAKSWAADRVPGADYAAAFPAAGEWRTHITLPMDIVNYLDEVRAERGGSRTQLIIDLLRESIHQHKDESPQ